MGAATEEEKEGVAVPDPDKEVPSPAEPETEADPEIEPDSQWWRFAAAALRPTLRRIAEVTPLLFRIRTSAMKTATDSSRVRRRRRGC